VRRGDLIAAALVGTLGLIELAATSGQRPQSVLTVVVVAAPLATRSRAPLASAAVMSTWWLVDRVVGGTFDQPFTLLLGPMLMAYSLALRAPVIRAAAGMALLMSSLVIPEAHVGGADYGFFALLLALPALTGWAVRGHAGRARELAALTERLERERGASERLAVAEERRRIAGELHDAIAHAVSRMVLQAGGAGEILSEAPERARAALAAIQDTGRESLSELRQSLRMLRAGDAPPAGPAPDHEETARSRRLRLSWPAWADIPLGPAIVLSTDSGALAHRSPEEVAALAVAAVAIALRRRLPSAAFGLALADQLVTIALAGLTVAAPFAAMLVCVYTLAVHVSPRRAAAAGFAGVGAMLVALIAVGGPVDAIPLAVMMGAAFAAALPMRAARAQTAQLQRLATRLARERDARARLATLDERARIARELHDSVAHAVSVMVLQAGAAEAVLDQHPQQAQEATRAIEAHGRAALRELQALLGVLQEGAALRAPQPSLRELEDLITGTGLPVSLTVTGDPVPLPAGIDVTAYRIIQEALTNALKHAGPVPTTVALDYAPRRLTLDVSDAGGRPHAAAAGTGHGLVGMRERVSLYGGALRAGPRTPAGYAVHAELPLP
jgi:signal transduction histidine kinase